MGIRGLDHFAKALAQYGFAKNDDRQKAIKSLSFIPQGVKLDKSPLKVEFLKKKLSWIQRIMREQEIDLWITFTREGNEDPVAQDLRFSDLTWRSAAIIDSDGTRTAVVGSLEVDTVKQGRFYDEVMGYASEGVASKLSQIVRKRRPRKIAVNRSYDMGAADGLTSGMQAYLKRILKSQSKRLVSGEDLAITLRARLVQEEVELVKKAVVKCEKIYDEIESSIRQGKRDKYVHDVAHKLVSDESLSTAWAYDRCPSVNVASNPMGHVGYHNTVIRNGDFVKLDFGVSYQGYCSDIQRVYFVGPGTIPISVKKMFETARAANDAALEALKPGVIGYNVDAAGRKLIVKRGYPEYKHALGHVLGRSTHEIGPLLGPRWPERYGKQVEKPVQRDMVFTIEPSVTSKLGTCNLEEDVLVTANGYQQLSKPQEDIIRVG